MPPELRRRVGLTVDTPEKCPIMLFVDLQILAEAIAGLTPAEAAELLAYIEQHDGAQPTGCLAEVGPRSDGGGAAVQLERVNNGN